MRNTRKISTTLMVAALILAVQGQARAQTPDGETPRQRRGL